MSSEWWSVKLLALTHDPPWKYWSASNQAHEAWPSRVETIFGIKKNLEPVVRDADNKASALDKVLSGLIPSSLKASKLVNVFRPEWGVDTGKYESSYADKFIDLLRKLVKELHGKVSREDLLKYVYMLLYVGMEKLWRDASTQLSAPLADPKIPTYTIFDHLQVTALTLNSVVTGKWVLVKLDIPGIQDFISKGRKTRDFWAGSWILSLMAWKLVEDLVDKFGPDIVISPSLTVNPFFVTYLLSRLKERGVNVEEESLIAKVIPEILFEDWPSQPVMPASNILLLLPLPSEKAASKELNKYVTEAYEELRDRNNRGYFEEIVRESSAESRDAKSVNEAFRKYFEDRLRDVWRSIAESVLNSKDGKLAEDVERFVRELCSDMVGRKASKGQLDKCEGELVKKLINATNATKEAPPVRLRVITVLSSEVEEKLSSILESEDVKNEIREVAKALMESFNKVKSITRKHELGEIYDPHSNDDQESGSWVSDLIKETLWLKVAEDLANEKKEREDVFAEVAPGALAYDSTHGFTKEVYESSTIRRWRACSVCGLLPAVVRRKRINEGYLGPPYLLDEGEALCPYCLVKRLTAKNPGNVVKKLFNMSSAPKGSKGTLPSTLDIANIWTLPNIIKNRENLRDLAMDIIRKMKGINLEEVKNLEVRKLTCEAGWRKLLSFIEEALRSLGIPAVTDGILDSLGISLIILHNGKLELLVKDKSRKMREKFSNELGLYLSYVKGDGDRVGSGYHRGILLKSGNNELTPEEYIEEVLKTSEILSRVPEDVREEFLKAYSEAYGKLVRIADLVYRKVMGSSEGHVPALIVTPSYLFTLSKSLSIAALVDAQIIEALGGITVYSGGDDVAALLPVIAPSAEINADNKLRFNLALLSVYGALVKLLNLGKDRDRNTWSKVVKALTGFGEEDVFVSPTLLALMLTRLNYWGLIRHTVLGEAKGFHAFSGLLTAATAWYGRSYGVLIAHYHDPMWLAFAEAGKLEEMKDSIERSDGVVKDVVNVAYGRLSGVFRVNTEANSILLNNIRTNSNVENGPVESLRLTHGLVTAVRSEGKMKLFSKSLFYDAMMYSCLLNREQGLSPQILELIALELARSNEASSGGVQELRNNLGNELKDVCKVSVKLPKGMYGSKELRYLIFEVFKLGRFIARV